MHIDDILAPHLARLDEHLSTDAGAGLVDLSHLHLNAAPVQLSLAGGRWEGDALLVDAGASIVVAHVAAATGRMTLLGLAHGQAWLRSPEEACIAVLSRGDEVIHETVTWPDMRWTGPDGIQRDVALPTPDVIDALLAGVADPDPDTAHGVRWLLRRRALRHLLRHSTAGARDLASAVLADGFVTTVDDLVKLQTCLTLPNPGWVARGVERHPALLAHFERGSRPDVGLHPSLAALAGGEAPFAVARRMVVEATRVQEPSAFVVRSFAGLRDLDDMDPVTAASLVGVLARFHAERPRHRSLTPAEMEAVMAIPTHWRHLGRMGGPSIIEAMVEDGEVRALPENLYDPVLSLIGSLDALASLTGRAPAEFDVNAIALGVAFAPGRKLASLRRIDASWHADLDRHLDAIEAVRDSVRARQARPGEAKAPRPFPHFLDAPVTLDGVTATPLASHAAFRAEGNDLRHCIASYSGRAGIGEIQCVSLSGPDTERSTVAYGCPGGAAKLVQHSGPRNDRPSTRHAAVATRLLVRFDADPTAKARIAAAHLSMKDGVPRHAPVYELSLDAGERGRLVDLHFGNVARWLTPSRASSGAEAWLTDVLGAPPIHEVPRTRLIDRLLRGIGLPGRPSSAPPQPTRAAVAARSAALRRHMRR